MYLPRSGRTVRCKARGSHISRTHTLPGHCTAQSTQTAQQNNDITCTCTSYNHYHKVCVTPEKNVQPCTALFLACWLSSAGCSTPSLWSHGVRYIGPRALSSTGSELMRFIIPHTTQHYILVTRPYPSGCGFRTNEIHSPHPPQEVLPPDSELAAMT